MEYLRINSFKGLNVMAQDAPDNTLAVARNVLLRPQGAAQRMPAYYRLWNQRNMATELAERGLTAADKVVLVEIGSTQSGWTMRVLVAYDMQTNTGQGVFFVGDENGDVRLGSSNTLQFPGTITYTTLKTGWTSGLRVFFSRIYGEIWIGNGVDPNLIYSQTRSPKLREAGTNDRPDRPLVGEIPALPPTDAVAATLTVPTDTSSLVFTADPVNCPGTAGNNVRVAIVNTAADTPITSSRSGAGTVASPFFYTLTIGNTDATSSADAIESFVTDDFNARGVLTVAATSPESTANPTLALASTALSGGANAVQEGGMPSAGKPYRFALCLYDPGTPGENLAYEGPSSELSTEVIGSGNDLQVTVAAKAADVRFTQLTLWLAEYTGTALIRPIPLDGPHQWRRIAVLPNSNGTYRINKNFEVIETGTKRPQQARTPPCTMFEFAGDRVWCSGNAAEPYRVWLSKPASALERVPEGAAPADYLDTEGRKEEPSRPRVSALRRLETRMQVHTDRSVTLLESGTLRRIVSRSDFGALNPSCLAAWNRPHVPYLAANGDLYNFSNTQYYRSDPAVPDSAAAMRDAISVSAITANPNLTNMLADATNELLLIFTPMKAFPGIGNFVFDTQAKTLTGPHDAPYLISTSLTSIIDNRFVGITSTVGDLMVVDLNGLHRTAPPAVTANSPFTLRPPDYLPPVPGLDTGFPKVFVSGPPPTPPSFYERAYQMVLETQWLDLGQPDVRKGWFMLTWSTARFSRAIVRIVVMTDDGASRTFEFGQLYGKDRWRVPLCMSGNALKVRFEATVAEDKPFILQDLAIGYEMQTNAGNFFMM